MDLNNDLSAIKQGFDGLNYILDEELATILFLVLQLQKPLLLEGNPGVGKTDIANTLAQYLGTDLIRLQCYEGLDVNTAVYEWNYQKQLLAIKIQEGNSVSAAEQEEYIFGEDFLLRRPLLKAITAKEKPPVLLIDEIDRSDEEFEAFLLELLSAYQITIPDFGTIQATHKPYVILTSNRTRELGDALKRRCLYHWVDYPDLEKEMRIVQKHFPAINQGLAEMVIRFVGELRKLKLDKTPGIAETLDWVNSLLALQYDHLTQEAIERTLGCVLKSPGDMDLIKSEGMLGFLQAIGE